MLLPVSELLSSTKGKYLTIVVEFREQYKEAKEEVDNSCFICSIQRDSFREKGIGMLVRVCVIFVLTPYQISKHISTKIIT